MVGTSESAGDRDEARRALESNARFDPILLGAVKSDCTGRIAGAEAVTGMLGLVVLRGGGRVRFVMSLVDILARPIVLHRHDNRRVVYRATMYSGGFGGGDEAGRNRRERND